MTPHTACRAVAELRSGAANRTRAARRWWRDAFGGHACARRSDDRIARSARPRAAPPGAAPRQAARRSGYRASGGCAAHCRRIRRGGTSRMARAPPRAARRSRVCSSICLVNWAGRSSRASALILPSARSSKVPITGSAISLPLIVKRSTRSVSPVAADATARSSKEQCVAARGTIEHLRIARAGDRVDRDVVVHGRR